MVRNPRHSAGTSHIYLPLPNLRMPEDRSSEAFQEEWVRFLVGRHHRVQRLNDIGHVLQSRDRSGLKYRWLLFQAKGKSRTLSGFEYEDVRHHISQAQRSGHKTYVVVRFRKPVPKVIVIPAERVLKRNRILPHKGGLAWMD